MRNKEYKRRRRDREEIEQGIAFSNYEKLYLSDGIRFFGVMKQKKMDEMGKETKRFLKNKI